MALLIEPRRGKTTKLMTGRPNGEWDWIAAGDADGKP